MEQQNNHAEQQLVRNKKYTKDYINRTFPNENFLSDMSQFYSKNKYTKGLVIPANVKVAESRIPTNAEQRRTLRKELRQAGILAKLGNIVYLTPEPGEYKKRVIDAVVNGIPFEFRNITGKSRQVEQEFSDAKTKDNKTNVFINIDSNISRYEVRRRIKMVLDRHPEYTGKIIVSFYGQQTHFWDTGNFR